MLSNRYILYLFGIFISIPTFSQVNLKDSLIAYYSFSGNVMDSTGNYNGTIVNGTMLSKDACNRDTSAMFFDGINDRIETKGIDLSSSNKLSIAVFVKALNITTNPYYNICRQGPWPANLLLAYQDNGQRISFGLYTGSTYSELDVNINANYHTNGNWHSIVGTYDGSMMRLYVDGSLIGSKVKSGNIVGPSGFVNTIGSYNSIEHFYGYMDELRYHNRVLNQAEITAYHNYFKGGNITLDSLSICSGDSVLIGKKIYSKSGVYNDTTKITSCGYNITKTTLTVNPKIDTNVVLYNNILFGLQVTGNQYQWYDCNTNLPIANANKSTYEPVKDGSYRLMITKNGCTAESGCHDVKIVSIGIAQFSTHNVKIYPNPVHDILNIVSSENTVIKSFKIYNILGEAVLLNNNLNTSKIVFNVSHLKGGLYFIEFENGNSRFNLKFIKN